MNKIIYFIVVLTCSVNISVAQPFLNHVIHESTNNWLNNNSISNHKLTDIDLDGDDDYLLFTRNKIMWFDTPLTFTDTNILFESDTQLITPDIFYYDVNSDNKKDILFAENDSLYYLENIGSGNFQQQSKALCFFPWRSNLIYLNNDSLPDIYNLGVSLQTSINQGDFNYPPLSPVNYNSIETNTIYNKQFLDFNEDGFMDLVLFYNNSFDEREKKIALLENDGSGQYIYNPNLTYTEYSHYFPWFNIHQFDYDNDGDLDLFYNHAKNIKYIENLGNNSWSTPKTVYTSSTNIYFMDINFVDIDFDNKKEIQLIYNSFNPLPEPQFLKFDNNGILSPLNEDLFITYNLYNLYNTIQYDVNQDGYTDMISLANKSYIYDNNSKLVYHKNLLGNTYSYQKIDVCDSVFSMPNGNQISTSGVYTDSIPLNTLFIAELNFHQPDTTEIEQTICEGNSYNIDSSEYFTPGVYSLTLNNQYGCDSIVMLTLNTVPQPQHSTQFIETTLCQYTVNGIIYTSDTIFSTVYTTPYNCDSIVDITLIFKTPEENNDEYSPITLGTFVSSPFRIQSGDIDLDGDLDLIVVSLDSSLFFLEQTSPDHYKEHRITNYIKKVSQLEVSDFDNDGDLDIKIITTDMMSQTFVNHLCGFQNTPQIPHPYYTGYNNLGTTKEQDINLDGIKDEYTIYYPTLNSRKPLVILSVSDSNHYKTDYIPLQNALHYADLYNPLFTYNIKLDFINQDSIIDVILYKSDTFQSTISYIHLYLSDHDFNYTQHILQHSFSRTSYQAYLGGIDIVDFNQDGLTDIVATIHNHYSGFSKNQVVYYKNNGEIDSLTFTPQIISAYDPIGFTQKQSENSLYTSISTSLFGYRFNLHIDQYNGIKMNIAGQGGISNSGTIGESCAVSHQYLDADLDGDIDIMIGDKMFENISDTSFTLTKSPDFYNNTTNFSHYEDINKDGKYDYIYLQSDAIKWAEYISEDSIGPIQTLISFNDSLLYGRSIKIVDFDFDGDKDILKYKHVQNGNVWTWNLYLLENNGSGLADIHSILDSASTQMFNCIIDFDQDGDKDILLKNRWLENIGSLNFESQEYQTEIMNPQVILDYNQDGYLDVLSKTDSVIAWYYNDGDLNFEPGELITNNARLHEQRLKLIDIDNDNDLDVYAMDEQLYYGFNRGSYHTLYKNPNFTPANPNPLPTDNDIEFVIYPNPNNGVFGIISPYNDIKLQVYSIDGKLLLTHTLHKDLNSIDFKNHLPSGTYLLTFYKPGQFSKTERLIIL